MLVDDVPGTRDLLRQMLEGQGVNVAAECEDGLGVLEAMLAGLPVVASRVSSLPELVVDGETGFLVRPDDASALVAGVARALEQPALGEAGRTRAHREFSVTRMAERTARLYRSL